MARDDLVRIIVSVPEMYAAAVNPGDRVLIRLQALAGKDIEGKVTRTSWSLDPRTRTLRTEIDLPNPGGDAPARSLRLRDHRRRGASRAP